LTVADITFPEPILWRLPVKEQFAEDDLKRLPPLFYDEDSDIENLLLIHKFVAVHNPMLEVYIYEHENEIFSAMFVERAVDSFFFSLNLVQLNAVDHENRFEHIRAFKPRTIGELFSEAEADGFTIVAEEFNVMMEFPEGFFPRAE